MLVAQTARYIHIVKKHEELVDAQGPVLLVSAPGRTEIGGNHTDHNKGKVLAAAVNLDTLAAVSARGDGRVRVFSEGYPALEMDLAELLPQEEEKGTSASLIRGVAAKMKEMGYPIGGFDAVITSLVRGGSGLSSSASFEVLVCAILDALYGGWSMDPQVRAQISQYAENIYFGKPSGLMDQMASSVGGLTFMDFKDDQANIVELNYDFARKGMALVVVNTGGSHDDLTPLYAAIPEDMRAVAAYFGEKHLRRVRPEQFMQAIPSSATSCHAPARTGHFAGSPFLRGKQPGDGPDGGLAKGRSAPVLGKGGGVGPQQLHLFAKHRLPMRGSGVAPGSDPGGE